MATQAEIDEVISNVAEGEFQKFPINFFYGKPLTKREVIILYYN